MADILQHVHDCWIQRVAVVDLELRTGMFTVDSLPRHQRTRLASERAGRQRDVRGEIAVGETVVPVNETLLRRR